MYNCNLSFQQSALQQKLKCTQMLYAISLQMLLKIYFKELNEMLNKVLKFDHHLSPLPKTYWLYFKELLQKFLFQIFKWDILPVQTRFHSNLHNHILNEE